ncbi:5-hydroxytryptamine receptor 3A-like isoform X1 [Epinephelus fuscoguttatus]|uniref:5-hydroxytryptamine receptor 3A-like isoform X1 n=1 Tax=Epinephelus fuscoguttatus TaxID=293821 RepID=UPI0020D1A541|nr:5-hydroxytryptamine receptor 3A-like isoform X1 [Epinephelus fuscoguttatus]
MMLAGFLFLLLTGGSTSSYSEQPELLDVQQKSNQSFGNGGNTSSYSEESVLQQNFNQSSQEDGESSNSSCSYRDLLKHLNLTKNELHTMTLPVRDHTSTMQIELAVLLYAILDVKEKDQKFVSYICTSMFWKDEYIRWDPKDFCGIEMMYISSQLVWKPDLIVQEMTDQGKAPPSPYLIVRNNSEVVFKKYMVVVSNCRMQIYKFPFDIQSCNLTFRSAMHKDKAIKFEIMFDSSTTTEWSHESIQTQSEWLFINMTVSDVTVRNKSYVIYTISMKRRSLLYIVNFLLPIMFFLCLDLASFLISDSGGEKLGFKVTVLLAVTVMQLILNEILPSSSDRTPLIAIYCIGVFGLMLLSLLETIVVMYLMEKDSDSQDSDADRDQSLCKDCGDKESKVSFHNCFREVKKLHCACICDVSPGEAPSERLSMAKEGSSSQLTEECRDSEKLSDELVEAMKTLSLLLSSRKEGKKWGYWTRMTKTINKVFFIFYIIAASVFLAYMFIMWSTPEKNSAYNSENCHAAGRPALV